MAIPQKHLDTTWLIKAAMDCVVVPSVISAESVDNALAHLRELADDPGHNEVDRKALTMIADAIQLVHMDHQRD